MVRSVLNKIIVCAVITLSSQVMAATDPWYENNPSCVIARGNPGRTGEYIAEPILKKPKILWDSEQGGAETLGCYKDMILQPGLYALNVETGKLVWKFPENYYPKSKKLSIHNDVIYNSSTSVFNQSNQKTDLVPFVGFSPINGEVINKPQLFIKDYNNLSYEDILPYGQMIFYNEAKAIIAYSNSTKKIAWRFDITKAVNTGTGPISTDGERVYVSDWHNSIYALDFNTGRVVWSQPLQIGGEYITVYNGNLYISSFDVVYALDAKTGKIMWKTPVPELGCTTLAVNNQVIITGNILSKLRALDRATGKILWTAPYFAFNNIIIVGNAVYFIRDKSYDIVAVDVKTGKLLWKKSAIFTPSTRQFMPEQNRIIAYQNKLFIGWDGDVYALQ